MDDVLCYEIDEKYVTEVYNGNIKKAFQEKDCLEWTADKVQRAFNFGNGKMKDFRKYINNNRKYAYFLDENGRTYNP